MLKTDPYAVHCEVRPDNASKVYDIKKFKREDKEWKKYKKNHPHKSSPINIEVICVCNFQPVPRENYRIGVPASGIYKEVFNSDRTDFGGSGVCNLDDIVAENIEKNYLDY